MPSTISLTDIDLGPLDAETDQNFDKYSVNHSLAEDLAKSKYVLITAPKGYGKSGLARLVKDRLNQDIILINQSTGFDVDQLETKSSAEIRRKFNAFFIGMVISHLYAMGKLEKGITDRILESQAYSSFKKLVDTVKIKPPFIEVALSDIFPKSKAKNVAELLSTGICDGIRQSLSGARLARFMHRHALAFSDARFVSSLGCVCACRVWPLLGGGWCVMGLGVGGIG